MEEARTDPVAAEGPPYILLVDDDDGIRRVLTVALERAGYRVSAAGNAEEAFALLEHGCPDALVADLIMPGVTGDEIARYVHQRCPNCRMVFVSGFREEQLRDFGITQVVFMPKPVSLDDLRQTMKRLLGR